MTIIDGEWPFYVKLEKAAQDKLSAKYRPTRLVVDAAYCVATCWQRADTAVTKLQISPLIVNGFKNGFHQWIQHIFLVVVEAKKFFFRIFFCFQNLDALYRLC